MKKFLVIDNIGWPKERAEDVKKKLAFIVGELNKTIKFKNKVIVHLQKDNSEKDLRAEYDGGVINIFERSPDWRGDFLHELAHQIFERIPVTVEAKLNNIKRKLKKEEGDGRIFLNDHTYKNWAEVLSTYFKWWALGKVIDKGYLEVLNNYQPDAEKIIDKLISSDKLEKSNIRLVLGDISKIRVEHRGLSINTATGLVEKDFGLLIKSMVNPDDSKFTLQGKIKIQGMKIGIENKKGSYRKGKDPDGKEWKTFMHYPYGLFFYTVGKDKDHLDVYIGPNKKCENVYIVHQNNPKTGKYDEDKVMLGFDSKADAKKAYYKQYDNPSKFFGTMTEMSVEDFKGKIYKKEFKGSMVKSVTKFFFNLFKARRLPVGTIREYNGKKYKKVVEGKWLPYIGNKQKSKSDYTMQDLADQGKKNYQIEQRIRADFGGTLNTKKAKEDFSAALKKDGVMTSEEIKQARLKIMRGGVNKKDAEEKTSIKSISDIEKKYKDVAKIELYESKKGQDINLSTIITKKRESGVGTKIMNDIVSYADKNKKTITLTPSSDYGGSKQRLIEFYKRFGFVENKGKNKDFEFKDSMYRIPK